MPHSLTELHGSRLAQRLETQTRNSIWIALAIAYVAVFAFEPVAQAQARGSGEAHLGLQTVQIDAAVIARHRALGRLPEPQPTQAQRLWDRHQALGKLAEPPPTVEQTLWQRHQALAQLPAPPGPVATTGETSSPTIARWEQLALAVAAAAALALLGLRLARSVCS